MSESGPGQCSPSRIPFREATPPRKSVGSLDVLPGAFVKEESRASAKWAEVR
jgi:hypothetical protein